MKSSPQSKRILTWLGMVVGLLIVAALGTLAFSTWKPIFAGNGSDAGGPSGKQKVPVYVVKRETVKRQIKLPGAVEGYVSADLYAKVGGYLESIDVDIGDFVEDKQVLAIVAMPEMKLKVAKTAAQVGEAMAQAAQAAAAVEQSSAKVASAKAMLKQVTTTKSIKIAQEKFRRKVFYRYDKLRGGGIVQEKIDEAQYQWEMAQAHLLNADAEILSEAAKKAEAEAAYKKTIANELAAKARVKVAEADRDYLAELVKYATLTAPFKGVVTRRNVHPGAYIQPADGNSGAKPLLTITRTDLVRVVVLLPMSDVHWLQENADAVVTSDMMPGEKIETNVKRFSAGLDGNSHTLRVELEIKQDKPKLRPGSFAYVELTLKTHEKAPVIPSSAILTDGNEKYVLLVKDNKLHKQPIELLYETGQIAAVSMGLTGGEQVVRTGGGQYAPGMEVISYEAKETKTK